MLREQGYRAVLAHPVASRLAIADALSVLGDFVGLGALLLLAYARAGSALGPAALFAVQALPALLVGTAGGRTWTGPGGGRPWSACTLPAGPPCSCRCCFPG